jgi:hypothetical protein
MDWTFDEHVLRYVVIEILEMAVAEKVRDIVGIACQEIIQAKDFVATFEQVVTQMTSEKAGTARDNNTFPHTAHRLPTP